MSDEDTISEAMVQRAAVYGLLSRLWDRELDEATLGELRTGLLRTAYQEAGGCVPEDDSATLLESLAVDFCQLFVGPKGHVLPYQSVWNEGRLDGEAVSLMKPYLRAIKNQEIALRSPLDHFANQLMLMRFLLLGSPTPTVAKFFRDHISWAESLCERTKARSESDFYRAMAQVTHDFLTHERETFHDPASFTS